MWEMRNLQNPHKALTVTRMNSNFLAACKKVQPNESNGPNQQRTASKLKRPTFFPGAIKIHAHSKTNVANRWSFTFTVHRSLPVSFGSLAASSFPTCTANALLSKNNNVVTRFIQYWTELKAKRHLRKTKFIWKTSSSPKNNFISPNFRKLHVYLSRYMLAKNLKKNMDVWCDILKLFQASDPSFCGSCTQTFTFCFKMLVSWSLLPKAYAKETPFMDLLLNSHVFANPLPLRSTALFLKLLFWSIHG